MSEFVILPEPISKNVFEQYLRLFEKLRSDIKEGEYAYDTEILFVNEIGAIDNVINAIERSLQDITTNANIHATVNVVETVLNCLTSWILVLASWEYNPTILSALRYNFTLILNVVLTYTNDSHEDFIRYVGKLSSDIERSEFFSILNRAKYYKQIETKLHDDLNGPELFSGEFTVDFSSLKNFVYFDYESLDPTEIDAYIKTHIAEIKFPAIKRYETDFFKIKNILQNLAAYQDIEELRKDVAKLVIPISFEELYTFNDETENCIWEIHFKLENDKKIYNASETGYLIWSFAKALETLDDIEVQLVSWGEGSKWFNFKAIIKTKGAKIDLLDILNKSRQSVEMAVTKTTTDEMRKFEAEKSKLFAEAEKIKKETVNMMDVETSKLTQELNIQNQILDLQKKEVEIEDRKADVLLKKLQAISQLSELIKDGIIQNNSSVQIMINDTLYLRKDNAGVTSDKIQFIDIKEKIEEKPTETT